MKAVVVTRQKQEAIITLVVGSDQSHAGKKPCSMKNAYIYLN